LYLDTSGERDELVLGGGGEGKCDADRESEMGKKERKTKKKSWAHNSYCDRDGQQLIVLPRHLIATS